jgi:hypothetical protein
MVTLEALAFALWTNNLAAAQLDANRRLVYSAPGPRVLRLEAGSRTLRACPCPACSSTLRRLMRATARDEREQHDALPVRIGRSAKARATRPNRPLMARSRGA